MASLGTKTSRERRGCHGQNEPLPTGNGERTYDIVSTTIHTRERVERTAAPVSNFEVTLSSDSMFQGAHLETRLACGFDGCVVAIITISGRSFQL